MEGLRVMGKPQKNLNVCLSIDTHSRLPNSSGHNTKTKRR